MLQNLHVKNLALIDETEVDFGPGLNILTGETGAGKSILMDRSVWRLAEDTVRTCSGTEHQAVLSNLHLRSRMAESGIN